MSTALLVTAAISSFLGLQNEAGLVSRLDSVQLLEESDIRAKHVPSIPHSNYPRDVKQSTDMQRADW